MIMLHKLRIAVGIASIANILIVVILKRKPGMIASCINAFKVAHQIIMTISVNSGFTSEKFV